MADCEQPRVPELPVCACPGRPPRPSGEAIAGWLLTRVVIAAAVWSSWVRSLWGARPPRHLAARGGSGGAPPAGTAGGPPVRPRPGPADAGLVDGGRHDRGARRDPVGRGHALRAGAAAPRRRQQPPGRDRAGQGSHAPDRRGGRQCGRARGPRRRGPDPGEPGVLRDRHGRATGHPATVPHRSLGLVLRRVVARRPSGAFLAPAVFGGLGVLASGCSPPARSVRAGRRWRPWRWRCASCSCTSTAPPTPNPSPSSSCSRAWPPWPRPPARPAGWIAASARAAGAVAGGLLGGAVLLRVDSLREVALLVPVAALAALQRQRHAVPLVVAAVAVSAAALGLTWLTSSEYLQQHRWTRCRSGRSRSPWSW